MRTRRTRAPRGSAGHSADNPSSVEKGRRGPCRPGRLADEPPAVIDRDFAEGVLGIGVVVERGAVGELTRGRYERPQALVASPDLVGGHVVAALLYAEREPGAWPCRWHEDQMKG